MRNIQIALLAALLTLQAFNPSAEALLPKKKPKEPDAAEKVRTYQPPPPETMTDYCEPYRKRASDLGQLPLWKRPFVVPQRTWAIRQHQKCTDSLMQQEWEYLRHADIPKGPSLPKLKVDEATTTPAKSPEGVPADATRP